MRAAQDKGMQTSVGRVVIHIAGLSGDDRCSSILPTGWPIPNFATVIVNL